MLDALTYARVPDHLGTLKLDRLAAVLDRRPPGGEAAKDAQPALPFLDRLLDAEVTTRLARSVEMHTQMARFPFLKRLAAFDFSFQPSIAERLVRERATVRFVANAATGRLLGPPGVGQTHLAIVLGRAVIAQGQHGPYFVPCPLPLHITHHLSGRRSRKVSTALTCPRPS